MATATLEKPTTERAKAHTSAPLMKFRLLAGGHDQMDPAFTGVGTLELRERVLAKRGAQDMDAEDARRERETVSQLSKPAMLEEMGAHQRFEANAADGTQPVIESALDLEQKYGRHRFARVSEDQPVRVVERVVEKRVPVDFDEMTADDLRAFAAEEEIELPKDADSKGKILAAIRAARRAR